MLITGLIHLFNGHSGWWVVSTVVSQQEMSWVSLQMLPFPHINQKISSCEKTFFITLNTPWINITLNFIQLMLWSLFGLLSWKVSKASKIKWWKMRTFNATSKFQLQSECSYFVTLEKVQSLLKYTLTCYLNHDLITIICSWPKFVSNELANIFHMIQ